MVETLALVILVSVPLIPGSSGAGGVSSPSSYGPLDLDDRR